MASKNRLGKNRLERISFRMAPSEIRRLKKVAEEREIPYTQIIRDAVLNEIHPAGKKNSTAPEAAA